VVGDILYLSAGDIIPGDVRILHEKNFFINQATLTGEILPIKKIGEEEVIVESISQKQSTNMFE
jgi:Mg2+-importing ATPase